MRLRNVLVAVEPTARDAHPLRTAMEFAAAARARLAGLSVADSAPSSAGAVSWPQGRVPLHHAVGIPAIEIARRSESTGADLIVLGRDLPTGRESRDSGATVEGTVRRARVPCLLVPRGQRPFCRVLAAVDGGPDSQEVMAAARVLGQVFRASVRAVHVEALVPAGVAATTWESGAPVADDTIVAHGDPVSEILRLVRDEDADLLVFGHHRGGPVSAHATSGVAARLLQRAPCAVLTVPV